MRKAFLWVAMMGLGACSGMSARSGRPAEPISGPLTGRIPGTIGDGETGPVNSTLPNTGSRQTLCRSTAYPRGWVAVDYVEGGSTCGSSEREPYAAVVLQRLAPLPEGTVLTICTGQIVPINWQRGLTIHRCIWFSIPNGNRVSLPLSGADCRPCSIVRRRPTR